MVKSLKQDLFSFKNSDCLKGYSDCHKLQSSDCVTGFSDHQKVNSDCVKGFSDYCKQKSDCETGVSENCKQNSDCETGVGGYRKQMEDPNNNIETCPHIERTDPVIGTSDSKYQPLDNVNLVFTSNGESFSITLHEVIGRGISSVVRRCTEKNTGREYAVKIIDISGERSDTYQAEQTKEDTIREINILRMCTGHEHIIELHDAFETPTFIFLVFELCKQGELFDYLTQVVTLSEKRTRIIMKQLLTAVEYLHSKNIVHRDLKPENILLDDNLNVKLSDFGFATVLGPNEELAELCGTPGYLAPEVLAVSMYDNVPGYRHEVDMWACGVIMYTLLCGAPPFWHRKQMQMLRMIMQGNYKFGSPEWDDVSQSPKDLISKLLVVDPRKRLTAKEALAHTFFHTDLHVLFIPNSNRETDHLSKFKVADNEITPEKKFEAKKHFKAAVLCVNFFYRLKFFFNNPPPVSIDVLQTNPYSVKFCRKLLDGCAFRMYGHWVKKADNQNRAALFEHVPRDEWQSEFPR